jgi:hypothetical protein
MAYYAVMTRAEQTKMAKELIFLQATKSQCRPYQLCIGTHGDPFAVYQVSFMIILGLKDSAWSSLINSPLRGPNYHGNIGNNNRLKGYPLADF